MKKTILSVLITLSLIAGLTLGLTGTALADCSPDGTANADNITCTGDNSSTTVEGSGDGDTITIETGATVQNVVGDDKSGWEKGDQGASLTNPGDDTITNNGTVEWIQGQPGDDTIVNNGTITGGIAGGPGADTITNNGDMDNSPKTIIGGGPGNDQITNNNTVTNVNGNNGADTIINNGEASTLNGQSDDDVVVNNGTVDAQIGGGPGDDQIINNGTTGDDIYGHSGNDTITNNDTVDGDIKGDGGIRGDGGNDIITNTGTVNGDIKGDEVGGNGGDDTITNTGTVNGDIKGDEVGGDGGDDTITNTGTVEGDIEAEGGDDTVLLAGTEAAVNGTIDGGEDNETNGDTLNFSMSTSDETQYNDAKTIIAGGGDGTFAWGTGTITWINFEKLLDNLILLVTGGTDADGDDTGDSSPTTAFADTNLSVSMDGSGTLNFYAANGGSNKVVASLNQSDYANAATGQVMISTVDAELGVLLYVVALGDGRISVQYYSTVDGSLLSSTVISL